MNKLLNYFTGPNAKTTISGGIHNVLLAIVTGALTFPSNWHDPKEVSLFVCVIVGTFFGLTFATQAKDKNVTGGSVQQTMDGALAKLGTQTLVDITKETTAQTNNPAIPAAKNN